MFFETKNLCFSYYKQPLCLKDINFSIEKNQKMICLASKDMGKTTFLKVLSSFESSYFGKILINGKNLKDLNDADKNFSLLFDEPVFLKNKSIKANIDYFCELNNLALFSCEQIEVMLSEWKFKRSANDKLSKLSLFEKRKFAIMRALLKHPAILFLDDQFENLDENEQCEMREIYLKLFSDESLSIIAAAGEFCYNHILKTDIAFDGRLCYLCNAELKFYDNFSDFEAKRDNYDIVNFLNDYESLLVDVLFEDKKYKLIFNGEIAELKNDLIQKSFNNFENQECLILLKREALADNINIKTLINLLENDDANLYALLGGERLI